MQKRFFVLLSLGLMLSCGLSYAATSVQSPIYNDPIGRSHFLSRGGYSTVQSLQNESAQASTVNETMNDYTGIRNNTQARVGSSSTDESVVPASSYKPVYSYDSYSDDLYGFQSGVNESKTIYTDDLGRLHFFGKANQFKD